MAVGATAPVRAKDVRLDPVSAWTTPCSAPERHLGGPSLRALDMVDEAKHGLNLVEVSFHLLLSAPLRGFKFLDFEPVKPALTAACVGSQHPGVEGDQAETSLGSPATYGHIPLPNSKR